MASVSGTSAPLQYSNLSIRSLCSSQNIKNFQSQRWQTLVNFNTQRRLLLTGTPLQNNLMELWSLLHFLMPHVFRSRKEFSYWFSNPMNNIVEGNAQKNNDLIKRLHGIIRPFLLRRLKKDVESQMPGKFEHVVKCQLSRRQMFLYEEFMARSSTRKSMDGKGNFMGMMNVLMQLRKVCNHPDLFEPRAILTPFVMSQITFNSPALASTVLKVNPLEIVSANLTTNMVPTVLTHSVLDVSSVSTLKTLLTSKEQIVVIDDRSIRAPHPDKAVIPSLKPLLQERYDKATAAATERYTKQHEYNSLRVANMSSPAYDHRLRNDNTINLLLITFYRYCVLFYFRQREAVHVHFPFILRASHLRLKLDNLTTSRLLNFPHRRRHSRADRALVSKHRRLAQIFRPWKRASHYRREHRDQQRPVHDVIIISSSSATHVNWI